jgi:hypothetical protein
MPLLSIDPDHLIEENRGVPGGQVGDAPCRLVAMGGTIIVDVIGAAADYADVPNDEPWTTWSRRWECGIEGGLQMPEIPSLDRAAVSIRKRENATEKGTIGANTVRLLIDHGTKESCVSSSNHFK